MLFFLPNLNPAPISLWPPQDPSVHTPVPVQISGQICTLPLMISRVELSVAVLHQSNEGLFYSRALVFESHELMLASSAHFPAPIKRESADCPALFLTACCGILIFISAEPQLLDRINSSGHNAYS